MITPMQLYWMTRLDAINSFLTVCAIAFAISAIVIMLFIPPMFIEGDSASKSIGRALCKWLALPVVLVFLLSAVNSFIPTTKEMAAIVVIPRVANSESVQQLGKGIVDLANQWLVELAPKHGEGEADGNKENNVGGTK